MLLKKNFFILVACINFMVLDKIDSTHKKYTRPRKKHPLEYASYKSIYLTSLCK